MTEGTTMPAEREAITPLHPCPRPPCRFPYCECSEISGVFKKEREKVLAAESFIKSNLMTNADMPPERKAIVQWLRGTGPDRDNGGPCRHVEHAQGYCTCNELADAIERGDHLKESTHE